MKKFSLIALLFSIVILSWCGKKSLQTTIQSWEIEMSWIISNETWNDGMETGTILKESNVFDSSNSSWECIPEKLNDVQIFDIDQLVKNCKEEKKEITLSDRAGWPNEELFIYNNQIVRNDPFEDPTKIICYKNWEKYMSLRWDWSSYSILNRLIWKWLLDEISNHQSDAISRCSQTYCSDMLYSNRRQDGQNYFIAWYRNQDNLNSQKQLYVINDKLYYPWKVSENQESWAFVWIKNNKIIFKKRQNISSMLPNSYNDGTWDETFILRTCEIDL